MKYKWYHYLIGKPTMDYLLKLIEEDKHGNNNGNTNNN